MSYTKQTWQTGDVITAEKLNHMEDGIAAGGGSSVGNIVLHFPDPETATPDDTITVGSTIFPLFAETNGVTFQDVIDAFNAGYDTMFVWLHEDQIETDFVICRVDGFRNDPTSNVIFLAFNGGTPGDYGVLAKEADGVLYLIGDGGK